MGIRNNSTRTTTGLHGEYEWLTTGPDYPHLGTVLRSCPQVVLDKYIAITSFDSGPLTLGEDEKVVGWESRMGVAYSPKIQSIQKLPYDINDEWYVSPSPFDVGQISGKHGLEVPLKAGEIAVFVNWGGFKFHLPDAPRMQDLTGVFWRQLESIHPESYIADGDFLNFACRDKDLFAAVRKALA